MIPAVSTAVRKLTTPAEKVALLTPIYNTFFNSILNNGRVPLEIPLIPGDPERLKQVFTNVLDNASKHGHSDKIDVSLWEDKKFVHISFRDYGSGIPEDELPHVKEKFYKGSSKNRGTGIGLAVCDEIITRHNGTLDIRNAEGGGCIVTISLPMSSD